MTQASLFQVELTEEEEIKKEDKEMVSFNTLAKLTGFSDEIIRKELSLESDVESEISLTDLRKVMARFVHSSMLNKTDQ